MTAAQQESTMDLQRRAGRGPAWSVAAGICGIFLLGFGVPEAFPPDGQWDFETYYHAVEVYDAGGNPWDRDQLVDVAGPRVLNFIYPHHTFVFFRLFALDDLSTAKTVYLLAKLGCVVVLCVLWATCFVPRGVRGWFLAFAALGYSATIWRDLVAGNVSLFEQTLIWFGVFALLRGRLWLFCVLIILAAQFKILPICLLGLVLLSDSPHKWRYFSGSVVACALAAGGIYLTNPDAIRMFLHSASTVGGAEPGGDVNPCALALIREVTADILERFTMLDAASARSTAYLPYAVYVLAVLLALARCIRGGRDIRSAVFLGILTYALITPRMKDYSYVLLLLPTFELIRARMGLARSGRMLPIALAVILTLPELDYLWQYRPLLLAVWTWTIALTMDVAEPRREGVPSPSG